MTTSKALEIAINATWSAQRVCRKYDITIMTLHAWRKRGMPCIAIKGDKRPALRFVPKEIAPWIKAYRKGKK